LKAKILTLIFSLDATGSSFIGAQAHKRTPVKAKALDLKAEILMLTFPIRPGPS